MTLPRSVIPASDGLAGLAGLAAALAVAAWLGLHPIIATGLILLGAATPMLLAEVARAGPAGAAQDMRAWQRPARWLLGFVVATLPFAVLMAAWAGAWSWIIPWLIVAPAFVLRWLSEARRGRAWDGSALPLRLGEALARRDSAALRRLGEPARLWTLKAFFIPLYAASLWGIVGRAGEAFDVGAWLVTAALTAYVVDLTFGLAGYVFASDALGTGLRSTQRRVFGWVVCMACYPPFLLLWPDAAEVLLHELRWPEEVGASLAWTAAVAVMFAILAVYVWSTVAFGLRISNLANRGVVTHGPYRLMKHPAYFAHVANAWMTVLVLLPLAGTAPGPGALLAAAGLTVVYRLRAMTEEAHMSEDPAYRAYAAWIAAHGLLARLRRFGATRLRALHSP